VGGRKERGRKERKMGGKEGINEERNEVKQMEKIEDFCNKRFTMKLKCKTCYNGTM
jgi:hypothetical protein